MAIVIYDENNHFKSELIPHFIDKDSNQLDPCFAAFKRIDTIKALKNNPNSLIANLQMIYKASVRVDSLRI